MTLLSLATEDELSEKIGAKLVQTLCPRREIGLFLRRGGNGYLRSRVASLNQIAQRGEVILITDLDDSNCAPELINRWRGNMILSKRLIFRVAVREIESWVLADQEAFRAFLGVKSLILPDDTDKIADPKRALMQFARTGSRDVREDICKINSAVASQGVGYNQRLGQFVKETWDPRRAAQKSSSLRRACERLRALA